MATTDVYSIQLTPTEAAIIFTLLVAVCSVYTVAIWIFAGGTCCRTKAQFIRLQDIPLQERILERNSTDSVSTGSNDVIHSR